MLEVNMGVQVVWGSAAALLMLQVANIAVAVKDTAQ
jgi:hypothetical protein